MTTTIRLRGPADIITVLPYHLGYRPVDSLVLVCLRAGRLGVVGRIDLPPPDVDPQLVVDELLPVVGQQGQVDRAVLVAFESWPGSSEAAGCAMRDALLDAGIDVIERLVVRGQRWWSMDCADGCCPAAGEPLPGVEDVPAVAEYVLMGRRPVDSRGELATRLTHEPDAVQQARCAVLARDLQAAQHSRTALQRRRRRALLQWARILGAEGQWDSRERHTVGAPGSGDEAWALAVVSLLDVPVRDLLIAWLCPGTLDLAVFPKPLRRLAEELLPARLGGPAADRGTIDAEPEGTRLRQGLLWHPPHPRPDDDGRDELIVERLAMVCRQAPPELSPGPLTVLAHVVWWLGDGALARTALERALTVDPDYRLAALLERMVDSAVRPERSA